jgi:hypothetical protein
MSPQPHQVDEHVGDYFVREPVEGAERLGGRLELVGEGWVDDDAQVHRPARRRRGGGSFLKVCC